MIGTWHDAETEGVFKGGGGHRSWQSFARVARRKLLIIEAARRRQDLMHPPDNRFEDLKGKRRGQCSIRINDRYRVCFSWPGDGKAYDIEITDYHDE